MKERQEVPNQESSQQQEIPLEERWRDPDIQAPLFEERFQACSKGELERRNEDGSILTIRAYELIIDPMDQKERQGWLAEFAIRAAQAGYKQAIGPVVLPNVGYRDTQGQRPLTSVNFFLEKPLRPEPSQTQTPLPPTNAPHSAGG